MSKLASSNSTYFTKRLIFAGKNVNDMSPQEMSMPEVLYEEVLEVEERVVLKQDECQLNLPEPLVQGMTGEKVCKIYFCHCSNIIIIIIVTAFFFSSMFGEDLTKTHLPVLCRQFLLRAFVA